MRRSIIQENLLSTTFLILALMFLINAISPFFQESYVMYRWKVEVRKRLEWAARLGRIPFVSIDSKEIKTIEWREGGREMVFHKVLYDIYKIVKQKGKIICYCVRDDHEKLLLVRFLRNHHRRHENDRLKKRISTVLFCSKLGQERLLVYLQGSIYIDHGVTYQSREVLCESPPPKEKRVAV